MSGLINKTQLAEKRYRDKLEQIEKEYRLNTKKHKKNKTRQLKKLKNVIKIIITNYEKQKKTTKLQKKK